MEPKWDSVWDTLSGALPVFQARTSLPGYNLQLLLLCGSCIYFYTVSAVDTLCAGGPFILPCLKGNTDDILTLELLFRKSTYCTFLECPQYTAYRWGSTMWLWLHNPTDLRRFLFTLLFRLFAIIGQLVGLRRERRDSLTEVWHGASAGLGSVLLWLQNRTWRLFFLHT